MPKCQARFAKNDGLGVGPVPFGLKARLFIPFRLNAQNINTFALNDRAAKPKWTPEEIWPESRSSIDFLN